MARIPHPHLSTPERCCSEEQRIKVPAPGCPRPLHPSPQSGSCMKPLIGGQRLQEMHGLGASINHRAGRQCPLVPLLLCLVPGRLGRQFMHEIHRGFIKPQDCRGVETSSAPPECCSGPHGHTPQHGTHKDLGILATCGAPGAAGLGCAQSCLRWSPCLAGPPLQTRVGTKSTQNKTK